MRKMWRNVFTTAALTIMLCMTGLVMSGEAQAQRFVDNGNGTVTDTVTGLMWTKNANPFGTRLTWDIAMARCGSFSISGIGGWRLPSKDELVALYHATQGEHPFTMAMSTFHWSSTVRADYTEHAWFVFTGGGQVAAGPKTGAGYAWPVRTAQ
jgi:hypothetical protein